MKKLVLLIGLVIASIALFIAVFSVVRRPLVVGELQRQLDYKLGYARGLASPKIVVLAGSNGRFSHRCDVLSAATGMPCVNASIGVGIGLDYLFERWRPLLRAGDVVYLPLEYSQYRFSQAEMQGGLQNALLVQGGPGSLRSLGAARVVSAYGSFDLSFLLQGLAEMALERRGFRRRSSLESLTPQGDERDHSALRGEAYAAFLRASRFEPVALPGSSHAIDVIETFLRQSKRDGIRVIGGLPTVPDNVTVPAAVIDRLRSLYEAQGQGLLVLDNRSRYSMSCFYDTLYHLNETCQLAHSAAVGEALRDVLPQDHHAR